MALFKYNFSFYIVKTNEGSNWYIQGHLNEVPNVFSLKKGDE